MDTRRCRSSSKSSHHCEDVDSSGGAYTAILNQLQGFCGYLEGQTSMDFAFFEPILTDYLRCRFWTYCSTAHIAAVSALQPRCGLSNRRAQGREE
jgi:hypothetical protein